MFALCVLASPALADVRLFYPGVRAPVQQQPNVQFGQRVSVPVEMAAYEMPHGVPGYEMPRVMPVPVVAQAVEAQESSVPSAWLLTGAMLLGMGLYGGLRTSTLAVGGQPAATADPDVELAEYKLNTEWVEVPAGDKAGQMRAPMAVEWDVQAKRLQAAFGVDPSKAEVTKQEMLEAYEMMQLCRQFENACNQAYMQGHIRGFMHLDNGQEAIPALVSDVLRKDDIKYSYYREHCHAIASGVSPNAVMAELFGKDGGTCRGTGGSMHIYDVETHFQGGWALVAEQLPYAVGAARSILLDRQRDPDKFKDDDRVAVVFIGEGGAQNGRTAECLNAAAKENLPILFLVIDNGRAINTFTQDVAQNSNVYLQGQHYGVPGMVVDGMDMESVLKTGRTVVDHVRKNGPAILQVHTYRFQGHSPADPEHERGRKDEKKWARANADPIKILEATGIFSTEDMDAVNDRVKAKVKEAVDFANASPKPPASLAKELEFPDAAGTDYNTRAAAPDAEAVTKATLDPTALKECEALIEKLQGNATEGTITIGDAVNLAILEEMIRDPMTTIKAEDLQAGSSYNIPKLTQQTFGRLRASDEIIDEGHFIGKALGEGMNGYRPIVELMNSNFGIYGIAEISSAGNTYATTGGQFKMPMTIVGAGGTAPNQSLGAEHSQPLHAYVMGIPGLKICTAASPDAAYGLMKSMIRDNGPGMLFLPVKQMKSVKSTVAVGKCDPLNKSKLLNQASAEAVANKKAVTVLTYLHGVKEAQTAIADIQAEGYDIDLIELRSLKPLDLDTIRTSLERTHKCAILDESTNSGGVGATISAVVHEKCFNLLDAPVNRLCMDDAPVPYADSMEKAVVKRAEDLVIGVGMLINNKH
jgi:TPP-dependent pyruvate/acetoin dehydrogenase alpha subunit/pyruvate/2-oxoglutarate/acetoin dehydrogenase E1 component